MSLPSGENAGAHKREESVSSVVLAASASEWIKSEYRDREFRNAIVPSRATLGELSGPGPVVNWTGGLASSGCHQRFEAPPRLERWTTPRPSGVKIGESLTTPAASFVRCAAAPPRAGTVQISRFIPPRLRETATKVPSSDHDSRPKNGYTSSLLKIMCASEPSAADVASASGSPCFRRMNARLLPSGDHAGFSAHGTKGTMLPPKAGIRQSSA